MLCSLFACLLIFFKASTHPNLGPSLYSIDFKSHQSHQTWHNDYLPSHTQNKFLRNANSIGKASKGRAQQQIKAQNKSNEFPRGHLVVSSAISKQYDQRQAFKCVQMSLIFQSPLNEESKSRRIHYLLHRLHRKQEIN